jgi:hypothetical protein
MKERIFIVFQQNPELLTATSNTTTMADNKQQQYGWNMGPATGAMPYAQPGQGIPPPGAFPSTQFAGPAYGGIAGGASAGYPLQQGGGMMFMGPGVGGMPQAGINNPGYMPNMGMMGGMGGMGGGYAQPTDEGGPKPYSNESGSSSSYGDNGIFEFSERTIRMAFIR